MAYTSTGVQLVYSGIGTGPSLFAYTSTADTLSTISGAGYFVQAAGHPSSMAAGVTGGFGMDVGDFMLVKSSSAGGYLATVNAATAHSTSTLFAGSTNGLDCTVV
jgi:hypothetical protein